MTFNQLNGLFDAVWCFAFLVLTLALAYRLNRKDL